MDLSQSMFMQSAQRPGLFSASTPPRFSPFGDPTLDANPMLGMLLTSGMQWMFGSDSFLPGQFMPQQNMLDQMRAREFQTARLAALQQGFALDRPAATQMMEGAARMMGLPFGATQAQAASAMSGGLMAVMPFLAPMAPMTFDSLFGSRGSRGVLTQQVFDRGLHEVDPVTGMVGMSPETAAARAGSIYQGLFDQGPGRGLVQTRGMGAGAVGAMYTEMRRLGVGGGSIADMSPDRQAAALGVDMDQLATPAADKLKRDYDSRQATQSIAKMAGAVSAVRDLFGEHGRPDAPMQELFQKLNDLTAGGLAMQDPQRLEQMVRQTQSTLRMGGMTLDAYSSLLGRGGHLAQVMGVDPTSAAGFTLDAAGFASSAGGVKGMFTPAFGRMGREQLAATDQQLRAAARGSGQADQLGALVRYQEEVGGLRGEDLQIYEALKNGDSTYGPDGKPLFFKPGEMQSRLAKYMGAGDAVDYMRQREAGQEYIEKYRLDRVVREVGQPIEARQAATVGFMSALRRNGFANDAATGRVAASLSETLFDMDLDASADPTRRNAALADRLRGLVGDRDDIEEIVSAGYGEFGQKAQERLNRSPQAVLQLFNKRAMQRAQKDRRQAGEEAALAEALSPLNQSGPLARFSDVLRNPAGSFSEGLGRVLGITGVNVGAAGADAVHAGAAPTLSIDAAPATGRLALASAGVQAANRMIADAQRRGASKEEIDSLIHSVRGLVGGGAAADESLAQLRKHYGLDDDGKFDVALDDESDRMPQDVRDRRDVLRGLVASRGKRGGGIVGLMEQAGVAVKAQVSATELGDLDKQFAAADGRMAAGDPSEAARFVKASVAETLRVTDLALGDESTLRGMRASFAATDATRNKAVELQALAAEHGMDVGELVTYAGDDPRKKAAAAKAKPLFAALGVDAHGMSAQAGGPARTLTKADKDAIAARRALDAGKQNEKTLDAVLGATGGSLKPEQRKSLLDLMGKSSDQERMGAMIRHALTAYKSLDDKGAAGALGADEQAALEADAHGLEMVGAVAGPAEKAYKRHLGVNPEVTHRGIETLIKSTEDKARPDGDQPRPMKLTFAPGTQVKLVKENTLDFSGAEAVGSTPPLS